MAAAIFGNYLKKIMLKVWKIILILSFLNRTTEGALNVP